MIHLSLLCPITRDENWIEHTSRLEWRGGTTAMRRFNSARWYRARGCPGNWLAAARQTKAHTRWVKTLGRWYEWHRSKLIAVTRYDDGTHGDANEAVVSTATRKRRPRTRLSSFRTYPRRAVVGHCPGGWATPANGEPPWISPVVAEPMRAMQ
jgi:hypothetical protein